MEQAASYKYSESDINSARQFSKAAVLMCVRVGAGTNLDDVAEEGLMNHVANVNREANGGNGEKRERPLQSLQEIRKFAKGGMEEEGMGKETLSAGYM